jgi:6-phosphogluconolactonase
MPTIHNLLAGRYTNPAEGDGICAVKLDGDGLSLAGAAHAGENPSYLTVGDGYIYALNEIEDGCIVRRLFVSEDGLVTDKDGDGGAVMRGPGSGACHLCFDDRSGLLFASCYGSGHINCFNTGTLSLSCSYQPKDAHSSHAHCTALSSDGEWLFAADLGRDEVYIFAMEEIRSNRMVPEGSFKFSSGTGPRQVITGLSDNRILCINELDSTIALLYFEEKGLRLHQEQRLDSTRHTASGIKNYPGSAALSEDRKLLIVPNRGANTLALFRTDNNGLTYKYECNCHGDWPRYAAFARGGRYVLSANQQSGNIALFEYHEKDDMLSFLHSLAVHGVSCIAAL